MSKILSPCCLCALFAGDDETPPPAAVTVPHIGPCCRPCQAHVHKAEAALEGTDLIAPRVILAEDRNTFKGPKRKGGTQP